MIVAPGGTSLFIVSFSNKPNVGTLFVSLKPWDDRKDKTLQSQAVMAEIQKITGDLNLAFYQSLRKILWY